MFKQTTTALIFVSKNNYDAMISTSKTTIHIVEYFFQPFVFLLK